MVDGKKIKSYVYIAVRELDETGHAHTRSKPNWSDYLSRLITICCYCAVIGGTRDGMADLLKLLTRGYKGVITLCSGRCTRCFAYGRLSVDQSLLLHY
jgi:hypothetical protein